MNVIGTGTPTASVSAGLGAGATYITATGTIASTLNQGLTFDAGVGPVGSGNFTFSTTGGAVFQITDGTNGVSFDTSGATGPVAYSGTARPTKKITLSPEYEGAVLTRNNGTGTAETNYTGTMTTDSELAASSSRTYYNWVRTQSGTVHYYDVAVRVTLPQDFAAWATSNALVTSYKTNTSNTADQTFEARVYLEDGTNDYSSSTLASATWTTLAIDDSDLTDWNAVGETAVIYLRLGSQNSNNVRAGDIVINYLARF